MVLLGHTRAPTGGAPVDYVNNHPFEIGGYYLAHNGILINHEEVRKTLRSVPDEVQTDSITILHSIWEKDGAIEDRIRKACEELKGSYACWLYDQALLQLYLFRCISPLFVRTMRSGTLAFSSEDFPLSVEFPEGVIARYTVRQAAFEERGHFSYYTPYKF